MNTERSRYHYSGDVLKVLTQPRPEFASEETPFLTEIRLRAYMAAGGTPETYWMFRRSVFDAYSYNTRARASSGEERRRLYVRKAECLLEVLRLRKQLSLQCVRVGWEWDEQHPEVTEHAHISIEVGSEIQAGRFHTPWNILEPVLLARVAAEPSAFSGDILPVNTREFLDPLDYTSPKISAPKR